MGDRSIPKKIRTSSTPQTTVFSVLLCCSIGLQITIALLPPNLFLSLSFSMFVLEISRDITSSTAGAGVVGYQLLKVSILSFRKENLWLALVVYTRTMFGGNNANPLFPMFLEDNQFQYDSNTSTQLQLFANTLNRPIKRSREAEGLARAHKLQISLSNPVQDEANLSASIPNPNAVSTGLRLSLDDDERNSSATSASGSMPALPIMMSLGDNLRTEIDRQREEFDHYIRIQEEHIAKGVKEMKQRHMASFLGAIEKEVGKKLREKELEIENMNRKNRELVERIKQVAVEAQSWHYRARYNESVVNVLKSNLKQAIAQGADQAKEGCGDSEVDDAVSTYNLNHALTGVIPPVSIPGNKGSSSGEQIACKACKTRDVSMLLLPCRHLCLCQDCEGFIDVCPVCQSLKNTSVQVYMS